MRYIMNARLESIYGEAGMMKDSCRGIMLQLKTLEKMAKLNGLNLENSNKPSTPQPAPYSTPSEIAEVVRQWILKRYGNADVHLPTKP
jgi:hypothetical protein